MKRFLFFFLYLLRNKTVDKLLSWWNHVKVDSCDDDDDDDIKDEMAMGNVFL